MMQIDLIDTFLDLMETNSFNRTAERLGVKQSTVSTRIQSLEAQLGAPLFERSRAGTRPTPAGLNFVAHARALRHEWNEARRALSEGDGAAPRLRIGLQSDLATTHIGDWMGAFRRALPGLRFYIEADFSAQMSEDVLAGTHDLAILFTPHPHPDLHYEKLGEVSYHLISTEAQSLAQVVPDRLVLANYSPAFAAQQAAVLPQQGLAPVASGLSAAVCSLLRCTGGSAYVLSRAADALVDEGVAHFVQDAPILMQPVYSLVHVRRRHVATHRRVLALMRQNFPAPKHFPEPASAANPNSSGSALIGAAHQHQPTL